MITLANRKKGFSINFNKSNTKICLSWRCIDDKGYLYLVEKSYKFTTLDNFSSYKLYLRSISKDFVNIEMKEIKLNGAAWCSNDYSLIGKDIYLDI